MRPATMLLRDDEDLVASSDEISGNERGGVHVVNQVGLQDKNGYEWVANGHNRFPRNALHQLFFLLLTANLQNNAETTTNIHVRTISIN